MVLEVWVVDQQFSSLEESKYKPLGSGLAGEYS